MGKNLPRHPAPEGFDISVLKNSLNGPESDSTTLKFALPTFYYVTIPKEAADDQAYLDATLKYGVEALVNEVERKIKSYRDGS